MTISNPAPKKYSRSIATCKPTTISRAHESVQTSEYPRRNFPNLRIAIPIPSPTAQTNHQIPYLLFHPPPLSTFRCHPNPDPDVYRSDGTNLSPTRPLLFSVRFLCREVARSFGWIFCADISLTHKRLYAQRNRLLL